MWLAYPVHMLRLHFLDRRRPAPKKTKTTPAGCKFCIFQAYAPLTILARRSERQAGLPAEA
jgi:hypothetical protein